MKNKKTNNTSMFPMLILIFVLLFFISGIIFYINSTSKKELSTKGDNEISDLMDGDKITTMDFISNQADELLKNITYQDEEDLSKYCRQEENIEMPIDPKYSNIKNLGQLFTAIRCGNYQLKNIKDGKFFSGIKLSLNTFPNDELLSNLLNLGFSCEEGVAHKDCKTWLLSKAVDAKSLIILEPFIDFFESDED
ncbi:MAG: hypothetical protein RBS56_00675 [Candidatus Gracilibacteria bacterium]|jgi:hypothetical protein|nr:hypothetical protein [Candidatus Gracilibacteria bacterium]